MKDNKETIIDWFLLRYAGDIDINKMSEEDIKTLLKNVDNYIQSEIEIAYKSAIRNYTTNETVISEYWKSYESSR